MRTERRPEVVILATHCDPDEVGETWNAYKWTDLISRHCRVTLLTQYRRSQRRRASKVLGPDVTVLEWPEPELFQRSERFNAMLKPHYVDYYFRVRKRLRELIAGGARIDLVHQLTPIALRYPSPCTGLGLRYVLGPLSGSLPTPQAFRRECGSARWFTRLRSLDRPRLRWDPLLRRCYAEADLVMGAAPYVGKTLEPVGLNRFDVECEVGIDSTIAGDRPPRRDRTLRLLHVGRLVRTKGLRDIVRALGKLRDVPVTLTVAGVGEELSQCLGEAEALGVRDRIAFLGRVERSRVEELYAEADVFVFPSFREPTGSVLFEAMRHGLPVITADVGGPGFVVDGTSGIRIPALDPGQYADGIAEAIRALYIDEPRRQALGTGAKQRISQLALWGPKIERTMARYEAVMSAPAAASAMPRARHVS